MKTLHEIETWMVAAITGPHREEARLRAPVGRGLGQSPSANEVDAAEPERVVTPGPRMTAAERLDVYRAGYKARLVDCLRDDYAVLARLVGDDAFDALARAYVDRYPSSSPNLNAYGRRMSAFLRETAAVDDERRAFASELASLEWAIVEAIHAATTPPLDLAELQTLPPDAWASARLVKADSARLFAFAHPVNAVFQRAMNDDGPVDVPAPAPSYVVVYRRELAVWRMDLSAAMARVLAPLFEGRTIGEALAALEAHGDPAELEDAGRSLSVWFQEWTREGLFARVERG